MTGKRWIVGRALPLFENDVDTDALYPARFYTLPGGYDQALFADRRRGPDGRLREGFAYNDPRYAGARILLAGRNFGCGSSRENAVWALQDAGFEAIVAEGFGEIFASNAATCGLACLEAAPEALDRLRADEAVRAGRAELSIDLAGPTLLLNGAQLGSLSIDSTAQVGILTGDLPFDRALARAAEAGPWIDAYRAGDGCFPPRKTKMQEI